MSEENKGGMFDQKVREKKYNDQFDDETGEMTRQNVASGSCYESTLTGCGYCCGWMRTWLPCICCFLPYPYAQIDQQEEAVVEHFGKFQEVLRPGFHYINPCTQVYNKVDVRTQVADLKKQVIITKDNITAQVDASVYFRFSDIKKSLYRIERAEKAMEVMAISSLRVVGAMFTLQQILEEREKISTDLEEYLDEHTDEWGVKVEQFFIKDVILSSNLQYTLSSAAKERKLAESKIISAKSDVEAAKMMREAADLLSTDAAMQIRYLEAMQSVSKTKNQKVVFLPLKNGK